METGDCVESQTSIFGRGGLKQSTEIACPLSESFCISHGWRASRKKSFGGQKTKRREEPWPIGADHQEEKKKSMKKIYLRSIPMGWQPFLIKLGTYIIFAPIQTLLFVTLAFPDPTKTNFRTIFQFKC